MRLACSSSFDGDGGDHARPRKRRDDVGADVFHGALHSDNARQSGDAHFRGGVVGLSDIADDPRRRGEQHKAAFLLFAEELDGGCGRC